MIDLQLTRFQEYIRLKTEDGKRFLWDPIRKKWIPLTPEEWVRQLFVCYLLFEKGYNKNRINLEKKIDVVGRTKRFDVLVWSPDMHPLLMVECKAPQVPINLDVFFQIANYNLALQVPYLVLTNGIHTYCCALNYAEHHVEELHAIPAYPAAIK